MQDILITLALVVVFYVVKNKLQNSNIPYFKKKAEEKARIIAETVESFGLRLGGEKDEKHGFVKTTQSVRNAEGRELEFNMFMTSDGKGARIISMPVGNFIYDKEGFSKLEIRRKCDVMLINGHVEVIGSCKYIGSARALVADLEAIISFHKRMMQLICDKYMIEEGKMEEAKARANALNDAAKAQVAEKKEKNRKKLLGI